MSDDVTKKRTPEQIARVCTWCEPHFRAKLEGRSSDHTRCDDFRCGCHCQDRTNVN